MTSLGLMPWGALFRDEECERGGFFCVWGSLTFPLCPPGLFCIFPSILKRTKRTSLSASSSDVCDCGISCIPFLQLRCLECFRKNGLLMCWSPLPKHKGGGFKNRLQAELELKFSRRIGVKWDVDAVKEKKAGQAAKIQVLWISAVGFIRPQVFIV